MFRNPPDLNQTSKPSPKSQATSRPQRVQNGKVASLVLSLNSRDGAAKSSSPSFRNQQTSSQQRTTRAESVRQAPTISPRAPSWNSHTWEDRENPPSLHSRRANLAQRQLTKPWEYGAPKLPLSRWTSVAQLRDSRPIEYETPGWMLPSYNSPASLEDWHSQQSGLNRSWVKRLPGQMIEGDPFQHRSVSRIVPSDCADWLPRTHNLDRIDSWARRTSGPQRLEPFYEDESGYDLSRPEPRHWSPNRKPTRADSWPARRSFNQQIGSFYGESRQELFYGDLSPPHSAVPQPSPAEERPNPWRRRDSSGSTVRTPSPPAGRESLSHRVFERVRSMSPPTIDEDCIHTPSPQSPDKDPSIASYITRKLSQQWSDVPSVALSPPSTHAKALPSTPLLRSNHVDTAVVQDLLHTIDSVLVEHTAALQAVIVQSQQLLHEKELHCHAGLARDGFELSTNGAHHDVSPHTGRMSPPKPPSLNDPPRLLRRGTNSIPSLLRLIGSTAKDLGIALPQSPKLDSNNSSRELSSSGGKRLRRSYSDTDLTRRDSLNTILVHGRVHSSSSDTSLPSISKMSKNRSFTVTSSKITVVKEKQPLAMPPPNTREHSPGSSPPERAPTAVTDEEEEEEEEGEEDCIMTATKRIATLPTLNILGPSPSTSSSSLANAQNDGVASSVSHVDAYNSYYTAGPRNEHSTQITPVGEVDDSFVSRAVETSDERPRSQTSSPDFFRKRKTSRHNRDRSTITQSSSMDDGTIASCRPAATSPVRDAEGNGDSEDDTTQKPSLDLTASSTQDRHPHLSSFPSHLPSPWQALESRQREVPFDEKKGLEKRS